MFPESPIDTSLGFKSRVKFIVGPTFFGICIILWLVALLKGKFKHQNSYILTTSSKYVRILWDVIYYIFLMFQNSASKPFEK